MGGRVVLRDSSKGGVGAPGGDERSSAGDRGLPVADGGLLAGEDRLRVVND
jgi:hypothetical protein